MAQCRFCKFISNDLNQDGICPTCENVVGVTSYREHSTIGCLLLTIICAAIAVGAVYGAWYYGSMLIEWLKRETINSTTEWVMVLCCFLLAVFVIGRVVFDDEGGLKK